MNIGDIFIINDSLFPMPGKWRLILIVGELVCMDIESGITSSYDKSIVSHNFTLALGPSDPIPKYFIKLR